jgi:DNA-binding NtrC family response regulator
MQPALRILFVDDEETFLGSTAHLLRRAGYECDAAANVEQACGLLELNDYDLVIADVNMPGNVDLEFVRRLAERDQGLPVIIVTGYPSIASAIQSVELPVVAYIIKPFDFPDLLAKVQDTARRAAALRAVREELARLQDYRHSLAWAETHMRQSPSGAQTPATRAFVGMAMRNIVDSLISLRNVAEHSPAADLNAELTEWPLNDTLDMRKVLRETIATLEHTKSAFKSKELGDLRRRLEKLLEN